MAGDDLIADVMRILRASNPRLTADEALAIEYQIRDRWGGSRVYIGKAGAGGKAYRLGAALAAGATLREAIDAAGLTRTTGYRVLSRRWRVR